MALDYMKMNVLNSLDLGLHSKELFRKTMQRRPLGDIEKRNAIRAPRRPVISMQLVDVNDTALKTSYRPKSSSDIVEKQRENFHKLCAQTVKSASTPRLKHSQEENRNKPYMTIIQVKGENTHTRNQNRPQSCPNKLLTTSWSNPALKSPRSGPQRPKTSGSTPRTESRLTLEIDPEYYDRFVARKECQSQISEHRRDENHNLNVGVFVRGKKKEGQTDKDTQWLSFGGGVRNSAGLVDAFSVMKNSDEYFSIDGRTGMVVAKNLRKTDKVQIGINGRASKTTSSRAIQQTQNSEDEPDDFGQLNVDLWDIPDLDDGSLKEDVKGPVPLCWDDQLKKPEVKVWAPSGQTAEKVKPSVSETKPVVFKRLIAEEQPPSQLISPRRMPSAEGYKVRQRTKIRKWLDGTDTNFMTILSIDTRGEEEDKDIELIDYEKLINDQFHPRDGGRKFPKDGPPMSYSEINVRRSMSGKRKPSGRSTARSSSADSRVGSVDPKNLVRPTSRSITTGTLPDSPLKVTPASPTVRASPIRTIVTQPVKQQSPRAGKIIRGKTSDKMGRTPPSISANYNQGDTSYIQITQGVVPGEGQQSESHVPNRDVVSVQDNSYIVDQSGERHLPEYYGDEVPPASHQVTNVSPPMKMAVDLPIMDMGSEVTSVGEVDERKSMMNAESLQEIREVLEVEDTGNVDEDDDDDEQETKDVRKTIPAPSPVIGSPTPRSEGIEDPLESANREKTDVEEEEFNISVSIKPRDSFGQTPEEDSVHSGSGHHTPEN